MSEEVSALMRNRDRMLSELRQFDHLGMVDIEFSGSGDSGQVDEIRFLRSESDAKERFHEIEMCEDVRRGLLQSCDDFAWDLLQEKGFSGNDDGGQGVIHVDVKTGEVKVDFAWNVVQEEDDSFCLDGDGNIVSWDRFSEEAADASN